MPIIAKSTGATQRTLAPTGNHLARCVKMVHIGTAEETIQGKVKKLNKVKLYWELPDETHVFKEENGAEPFMVSKEYTLSMSDRANLRKDLESWRSKPFKEKQAEEFDITVLLGIPCMINVIHKTAKSSGNEYVVVSGITPLPKRVECPEQIIPSFEFNFDEKFSNFEELDEWTQGKIKETDEYKAKVNSNETETVEDAPSDEFDDMPF
tara:strand:+ start:478 stop:1104 length:627 start_codon:yes stop_codon:yes gene_type:complete